MDKLSSLSTAEYVKAISTFEAMHSSKPIMECRRCYSTYSKREKIHNKVKEVQNCETDNGQRVAFIEYGEIQFNYTRCVGNFYSYPVESFVNSLDFYEKGVMTYPGSLSEQPAKFVELMQLLHNLRQRKEIERQKEVQRKNGQRGRN